MLLTEKRLKSQTSGSGLDLHAGGVATEQVMHQQLLGATIDEELTFKEHSDQLCKKISPKIGLLDNMRTYLPIREGELFYNALIKPRIMLCMVWTSCSDNDFKRILRLQKRSA